MSSSVLCGGPLARGLAAAAVAGSALLLAACAGTGTGALARPAAAGRPAPAARAAPSAAAATASQPAAAAAAQSAATGAAAGPVTTAAQESLASGLPRCRTGQLSSAFTGLNDASGGAVGMTLILTSHSSGSCSLSGYAGLQLLGGHLTFPGPLATHVTWVSAPHRPVTLRPGGNAQALLTWHRSTLAGEWLEHPQRVEITPPGAYRHLTGMWPKVPVNRGAVAVWPLRPAPAGPVPTGTGTVRNPFNGMCVTAAADGTAVASKCDSGASQQWTASSDGTLRINGECLAVTGGSTVIGAAAGLAACDGSPGQQWQIGQVSLNPYGPITGLGSGNVLTDPGNSTAGGTPLVMGASRGDQSGPWQVSFNHYLGH